MTIKETKLRKISCRDKDGMRGEIEFGIRYIPGNSAAYFTCTASFGGALPGAYGGACHDTILEICPALKPFVDLHLADTDGAPMHALENAMFHVGIGEYAKRDASALARHLRISRTDATLICGMPRDVLTRELPLLVKRLVTLWREEAERALVLLDDPEFPPPLAPRFQATPQRADATLIIRPVPGDVDAWMAKHAWPKMSPTAEHVVELFDITRGRTRFRIPFCYNPRVHADPARQLRVSLAQDLDTLGQSFEEFCEAYGYDTDSRTAEQVYKATQYTCKNLQRLLGDDLDRWRHTVLEAG